MPSVNLEDAIWSFIGVQVAIPLLKYLGARFLDRTEKNADAIPALVTKIDVIIRDLEDMKDVLKVVAGHTTELAIAKDHIATLERKMATIEDRLQSA